MRGNNRRNVRPGSVNTNNPPSGLQRRIDHFRNRPLNTSRPPSMHVDEFEKQFNENSTGTNSSSTNNNNNNNNENNNNSGGNNDNDLLSTMQSSNDGGNERVKIFFFFFCLTGVIVESIRIVGLVEVVHQIFEQVHHRVIDIHFHQVILAIQVKQSSSNLYYLTVFFLVLFLGAGFSLRDRFPYGYPSSRYP
jgi:hypothetical protein